MQREVERLLRGASALRRQVAAHATVEQGPGGAWWVRVATAVEGASEQREFEAESCAAVSDAVALMLAVAVNPQWSSPEPGRAEQASPQPPRDEPLAPAATREPVVVPRTLEPDRQSVRARRPDSFWLSASLAGDVGSLPRGAAGAELVLAWQRRHVWLELSGAYWGTQAATAPASDAGADFGLSSLQVRGAYGSTLGRFTLGPFVGAGLERFSAAGFGGAVASFDRVATVPVIGAGGAVTWRPVPSGPLLFRLGVEAQLLGSRPEFVVLNDAAAPSPVHRPGRISARGSFGVGFCFF